MKIVGIIVGILVIVLVAIGLTMPGDEGENTQLAEGEGRVYFSITDDTADIQSVNEIEIQIEQIDVYNESEGWVTVSSNPKAYGLLALKADGKIELHEATPISAGTYDRVRVTLGDVVVDHTTDGQVNATLPSEEITFDAEVVVNEGGKSHVTLDFIADQSLHVTKEGNYVFAPVVEVESRSNAQVEVGKGSEVTVSGGSVDSDIQIGVDLTGNARAGYALESNQGLQMNTSSTGGVEFVLGGETYTKGQGSGSASENSQSSNNRSTTSVKASTEGSVESEDGDTSAESDTQVQIQF